MAAVDKELGRPGGIAPDEATPGGTTTYVVESTDENPELQFPASIPIYDRMRRTDTQIGSILRACKLPIQSANWDLDDEGVRPEVADFIRAELGLKRPGENLARRRKHGIVFSEHLQDALLYLAYGFMAFEQVYEPGPPTAGQEGAGLSTVLHLRKLAPRMPRTISKIHVGRDGGLAGISQADLTGDKDVFLPVDRLVFYCLDKEGAEWSGNSLLRTAYKDWLIKDQLIRLQAQIIERNGMGVPDMEYDPAHTTKEEAETVVADYRAGETAGMVRGPGTSFRLVGVTGSTVDPLPAIRYHDEKMANAALAMFMTLGHDDGARSLGETFERFFIKSLQAIAEQIAAVTTEHVIRDLVELNFGPDEAYPALTPGNLAANEGITTASLKELIDGGVINPDATLETTTRSRYGLPSADQADGMSGRELAQRGAYLGTLIRSGYDPKESMQQAGLDPVKHLGLLPVILQPPAKGTDLENAVDPVEPPARLSADDAHLDKATVLLERVVELQKERRGV